MADPQGSPEENTAARQINCHSCHDELMRTMDASEREPSDQRACLPYDLLRQNYYDIETFCRHRIDDGSDIELIFAPVVTKGLFDLLHIALRYSSGAFLLTTATRAVLRRA